MNIDNENLLISVIVPVYNVKPYLKRCIASIIGQTYKKLEIIIVDDGSTDGSGEICDAIAHNDHRILVIHQKNNGLSAARNKGLSVANGDLVSFVDSDDYMHKDMLKNMYLALICHNSEIVCCDFTSRGSFVIGGNYSGKVMDNVMAINMLFSLKYYKFYAWNKLYKKELFDNICYPEGRFFEDIYTTYQLFKKSGKVFYLRQKLYHYTIRDNSITNQEFSEKNFDLIYAIDNVLNDVKKSFPQIYRNIIPGYISYYSSFLHLAIVCKKNVSNYEIKFRKLVKKRLAYIVLSSQILYRDKILIVGLAFFPEIHKKIYYIYKYMEFQYNKWLCYLKKNKKEKQYKL